MACGFENEIIALAFHFRAQTHTHTQCAFSWIQIELTLIIPNHIKPFQNLIYHSI